MRAHRIRIGPGRLRAGHALAHRHGAPAATATAAAAPQGRRFISWIAVAMLTVGSVGYLGSCPALAVFGFASVFLYVLPALLFLLPASLVAAELASGWEGGVYNWVREGMSAPLGMVAVWCQFAQTIFYYPALLAYVGGTLAYVIKPSLANNGVYTGAVIVSLFWVGVLVSSRGTGLLTKLASGGTVIGTMIPGALLVVLGAVYLIQGNHSAAPINSHHILPAWTGLASVVLLVNSFFTYAGVEVNAVHVDELRDPGREFPRAMFLAAVIVLLIFIFPTLAISSVVPSARINLTAGVMQAFDRLLHHFGLAFVVPVVAIALAVGALAGMMSWLDGPSEGLLKIGREQGYLPPYFQRVNDEGIQIHILAAQGVVITIIGFLYAVVPTVSSAYWILAAMATQVYLIMYVLMFVSAIRLRRSQPNHARGYRAPALVVQCVLGVAASVVAFVIGFVPPAQFSNASPVVYVLVIVVGILVIGVIPPVMLELRRKPEWKAPAGAGAG